jgi:hypothetical protein
MRDIEGHDDWSDCNRSNLLWSINPNHFPRNYCAADLYDGGLPQLHVSDLLSWRNIHFSRPIRDQHTISPYAQQEVAALRLSHANRRSIHFG